MLTSDDLDKLRSRLTFGLDGKVGEFYEKTFEQIKKNPNVAVVTCTELIMDGTIKDPKDAYTIGIVSGLGLAQQIMSEKTKAQS